MPGQPEAAETRAQRYVRAMAQHGSEAFIANLSTKVSLLAWGHHHLPMTIDSGARSATFVNSPRTAYVDYTLEELRRFPKPRLVPLLKTIVHGARPLLALAQTERIVHLNNWMFSTNLLPEIDPDLAGLITDQLVAQFPSHMLAFRSLNHKEHGALITALVQGGWLLLPSRQIYLLNLAKDQTQRRDVRRDADLLVTTPLAYEELAQITAQDAARMARLYALLYLQKYSRLNPAFTAAFFEMAQAAGVLQFFVFRDAVGEIQSFGGFFQMGRAATMPLLGYDTAAPQHLGLYRLAMQAGRHMADRQGLHLNLSSGAAQFKLSRGGEPEIEFTAYYVRHLRPLRRWSFHALSTIANQVGIPVLQRFEL